MPGLSRLLRATVALGAFAFSTGASAEGPRVEVVVAGDSADAEKVEQVVRELLGRQPVAVDYQRASSIDVREVVTPHPGARPAIARIWIDLGSRERATVFLVDGPWERVLVRHVALEGGIDEVVREEMGHIVETSVEAMLAGFRIGLSRTEVEEALGKGPARPVSAPSAEPAAAPSTPPETAPSLGPVVEIGGGWEGELWSSEELLRHGPDLWTSVELRRKGPRPGVLLSGLYRLPVEATGPVLGAKVDAVGFRALGTFTLPIERTWEIRFGVGGGADFVGVDPVALDDSAQTFSSDTLSIAMLRLIGDVRYRLSRSVRLSTALALEAEPGDVRYVVEIDGQKEPVLDPWTFRVGFVLGVDFSLTTPAEGAR